ncbi:DNA-binding protein H-NS [Paraburkholderia sp. JPY158]|uniref:DNA-binding protein H-NS n=1 Tax=Paraburkholderia atlantica TaxID=2654982 RepID=A0A7W8QDH7_PARAM|nr:H-NS family nucleoid-associated regulatory protein [Paraburkholderia atlantica]MBB5428330.1 DNA-binding protein H-NS [Paraburkholderia atlantica]
MATPEQIEAKMKKLKTQAEALAAKKTQAVVDQIRDIMSKHGLTTADVEAKTSAKRATKGQKVSVAAGKTKIADVTKAKAAPKYQHPKTGATWTGHGRAPAWIAEAKDRNKFLIATGAEATVATTAGAVSKAKAAAKEASKAVLATAGKSQRKGPQPALYADPKTGATWSGRGRAPAWIAGAKDRTKYLIG